MIDLHNTTLQAVDDIKIEKTNSDLFAVENWRGKGHAVRFDNKQQNTDQCKINYDIDSSISTDIDSKVLIDNDCVGSIKQLKDNMCSKNPHQLDVDTFIDHSYSELSKLTKDHEEDTYIASLKST